MQVGDLVIINVPPVGGMGWGTSCQGMIIDRKVIQIEHKETKVRNRTWWYVLRSDTGKVEKFHEDWMEAGENGSW